MGKNALRIADEFRDYGQFLGFEEAKINPRPGGDRRQLSGQVVVSFPFWGRGH